MVERIGHASNNNIVRLVVGSLLVNKWVRGRGSWASGQEPIGIRVLVEGCPVLFMSPRGAVKRKAHASGNLDIQEDARDAL